MTLRGELLAETPTPLPFCLPQIPNEMTLIDPELPCSEDGDKEETDG